MNRDEELLLRSLDGTLAPDEAERLHRRLAREPALQARLERLKALQATLSERPPDAFAPFFSDRVMRRLAAEAAPSTAEPLYETLRWLFLRVAVACLLVAVSLSLYNALGHEEVGLASSVLEAVFGLPSTTLESVFFLGAT